MLKRILHIEDIEGTDYEFDLELPHEEDYKNWPKLIELGQNLLKEHFNNENDIINIEVLTLN